MPTVVVNITKGEEYDVYIGRLFRVKGRWMRSPFGNEYKIGRDGTREEVIELYRQWLATRPDLLARLEELRGSDWDASANLSLVMGTCW